MNTKSLLIGAALVAVGVIIGYFLNCNSCNMPKKCDKEMVQHHGMKDGHPGFDKAGCPKKRMHDEVFAKLNLTADQQAKIDAIFEAKREAMKAEREKTHAAIKAVLTPEQQKQFDELISKCCPMGGQGMNPECKKQGGEPPKPCCKK